MTLDLSDPTFTDERKAREYFEVTRWPNGPVCPHCGNADSSRIYSIAPNVAHGVREGLHSCQECKGQFTVMTGSVMESSHLSLAKWALAFRLMGGAKKGISAHQLGRTLGVSYKTAWFLCHRIREAMRDATGGPLGGTGKIVEADETYVGGKPRRGTDGAKTMQKRKTPVAVLVERDGRARATVMEWPIDGAIKRNIIKNVAQGTDMHTDEHRAYRSIEKVTGGKHFAVTHQLNEFAKDDVHNNTAESWNALLKRSIYGSFHHVSREHLSRYCDGDVPELDYRHRSLLRRLRQAGVLLLIGAIAIGAIHDLASAHNASPGLKLELSPAIMPEHVTVGNFSYQKQTVPPVFGGNQIKFAFWNWLFGDGGNGIITPRANQKLISRLGRGSTDEFTGQFLLASYENGLNGDFMRGGLPAINNLKVNFGPFIGGGSHDHTVIQIDREVGTQLASSDIPADANLPKASNRQCARNKRQHPIWVPFLFIILSCGFFAAGFSRVEARRGIAGWPLVGAGCALWLSACSIVIDGTLWGASLWSQVLK